MIETLKAIPEGRYWYVASPYSGFRGSPWEANRQVCRTVGHLARHQIPAFSPIAHSHGVCAHYPISPIDHGIWMGVDIPLMQGAFGVIVVKMDGWQTSKGVQEEITYFEAHQKPIHYIDPLRELEGI